MTQRAWNLAALASLVGVLGVLGAPAPSHAIDFGIFGSYYKTDDLGDTWGAGARFALFQRIQFQLAGTWYDTLEDDLFARAVDLETIPIDIGAAFFFGSHATGLYVGGGGTYFLLDSDVARVDDEFGWYLKVGYQFNGLFVEVHYRQVEGTFRDPTLGDDFIDDRVNVALDGFTANVGWRF